MIQKIAINIIDTHQEFQLTERLTQLGAPILTYSGSDDRFGTIMSSEFSFNMHDETAQDGRYLDLFTGEERRYLVEVVTEDNSVIWRGFLLPDIYSEPYKNAGMFVNFTAIDGLAVLRDKPFVYFKTRGVLDYIIWCLRETGLEQEVYFGPGIENNYMSWKDVQIFEENFYSYNENSESTDYKDCYDVLDSLLRAVGATVFQAQGKWFIIGFNRKHLITDVFKVYNHLGTLLRTETVLKKVIDGLFAEGLNVNMSSPFKTVQLNVSYKRNKEDLIPEELFKNTEITDEEYNAETITPEILQSMVPLKYWISSGNITRVVRTEDGGTYLSITEENPANSHVMHPSGLIPSIYRKVPIYTALFKTWNTSTNFNNDYITLKSNNTKYVSSQLVTKPLEIDFDIELRILDRVNEGNYKSDFYRQAFRFDILLGNTVIYSSRTESSIYKSDNIKISFEPEVRGPEYLWYEFPDYVNWKYRLNRFVTPKRLVAEIKQKQIFTSAYGKLNFRLYVPRNGDDQFTNDQQHVMDVVITKLEVNIKTWDDERKKLIREIRYSTKYDEDLDFSDGKNDLYENLFKLREREDLRGSFNDTDLLPVKTEDQLYYYLTIGLNKAATFVKNYDTAKIWNGSSFYFMRDVFGNLSPQSGIFIKDGIKICISKSRIDEFPYIREFLHGFTKVTITSLATTAFVTEYPREKYIEWKRAGSNETIRYLDAYAKMIHECQHKPVSSLEGQLLNIISPLDIVRFKWMGEKEYFPTQLKIDFSRGRSDVLLAEAAFQNLNDYAEFN